MQTLRRSHTFARLILAWFVLSLGVAMAAPLVKPQDILLVCSGSGAMKLLVKADDGSTQEAVGNHTLDCPLCAPASALLPPPVGRVEPPHALAYALQGTALAALVAQTAAPLSARGPPKV